MKNETPDDVIKVFKKFMNIVILKKKNIEQQINFDDHELQEVNPDELSDEEKKSNEPYESDNSNDSEEEETKRVKVLIVKQKRIKTKKKKILATS